MAVKPGRPARQAVGSGGDSDRYFQVEWRLLALVLSLLVALVVWGGWLARADLVLYDLAMATWRRPAPDDVVIVAADDVSIAAIGRWPWRRAIHATLIDRLSKAGAKVVGFDIMLGEPDRSDPAGDASLAQAIAHNGKVVLPVVQLLDVGNRAAAQAPLADFSQGAAALGQAHAVLDADGLARSVNLAEGTRKPGYPHFALALLQVLDPVQFPPFPESGQIQGDWLQQWPFAIAYAGPSGHFRRLSYVDVLSGAVPAEALNGKVVLVGATASGIGDENPTPVSGHGRPMAGVELVANVMDTLRRDIVIRPMPVLLASLLSCLVLLALLVCLRRLSPRAGLGLTFAAGLGTLVLAVLLLRFGQVWWSPAAAFAGCALAYPLWSWRRLEATQRHLDAELALLAAEPDLFGAAPTPDPQATDPLQRRINAVRVATERQSDARRFVRDVVQSLPVGVLVADSRLRVVLSNRRAALLLGLVKGKDGSGASLVRLLGMLHAVGGAPLDNPLGGVAKGQTLHLEVASDTSPAILLEVAPCFNTEGRRVGLIATLADIGELRAMQKSREDTMRFLSHDLRAPLASILTLLEGVENHDSSDPTLLKRIGRYASRSLGLADDLLRLARAEALDRSRFVEVDLQFVLEEAVDEVWPQARAKGIRIESCFAIEVGELGALVMGDAELLRRAAVNLLNNAIKFSPAGSRVQLSLAAMGASWRVTVQDEAMGIALESQKSLFKSFGRVRSGNAKVDGVGLGLVIVKTVAEAHGGMVELESEVGQGSRFILTLPGIDGAPLSGVVTCIATDVGSTRHS